MKVLACRDKVFMPATQLMPGTALSTAAMVRREPDEAIPH